MNWDPVSSRVPVSYVWVVAMGIANAGIARHPLYRQAGLC